MTKQIALCLCVATFCFAARAHRAGSMVGGHMEKRNQMSSASGESSRLRTAERFTFQANATLDEVAPLFGADKERNWAKQWKPQFVYPLPAGDAPGMVFTVKHGDTEAIWVNTQFDLRNGRIQYVYVIPDALTTVITLKLTPEGRQTKVDVEYVRTALSESVEPHIQHLAEQDRKAGPDWESQINSYLLKKTR